MFDNFDPKEKKVILIFLALLLLGVSYVYTNDLPWNQTQVYDLDSYEGQKRPVQERSYE